ncbi:MAG: GntR family transcriptional regulator [Chloroflexi bacterium]|nr:MAG: GntR family transcriptional regulator [Chloroflexota bacterium]
MIATAPSRPRYVQIEESLHALLETGGYRPGDKLPPEPELAQQIGVSRATLREALRSFEQQGIINRKQGVGTFVNLRPPYIESGLENLESIEMLLASRQIQPTFLQRTVCTEAALPKAAQRLGIDEGQPLTVVTSTAAAQGSPVAYLLEVTPEDFVPRAAMEQTSTSLLHFLLDTQESHTLSYAVAHIAPIHGTETICAALGVGGQTPLFFIEQTVYSPAHQPYFYSRNYYIPSFFDFHIIRKREA